LLILDKDGDRRLDRLATFASANREQRGISHRSAQAHQSCAYGIPKADRSSDSLRLCQKCRLLVVPNSLISGVESYSFIVPGCMFSCIVVRFSGAPPAGAARDTQC
jgi:hypothetical protein